MERMIEKKQCSINGPIEIRGIEYPSITLSDMHHHYIRVTLPNGSEFEFQRNHNIYLKEDMEAALITHGIISESK
jgi:hypothetical protein